MKVLLLLTVLLATSLAVPLKTKRSALSDTPQVQLADAISTTSGVSDGSSTTMSGLPTSMGDSSTTMSGSSTMMSGSSTTMYGSPRLSTSAFGSTTDSDEDRTSEELGLGRPLDTAYAQQSGTSSTTSPVGIKGKRQTTDTDEDTTSEENNNRPNVAGSDNTTDNINDDSYDTNESDPTDRKRRQADTSETSEQDDSDSDSDSNRKRRDADQYDDSNDSDDSALRGPDDNQRIINEYNI